ncbi:hypothetical protein GCM10010267_12240 [Streptomyces griseorubens]|nr:hypothetical protein GCM10010267_12240 [Streptomyces griseorubens]
MWGPALITGARPGAPSAHWECVVGAWAGAGVWGLFAQFPAPLGGTRLGVRPPTGVRPGVRPPALPSTPTTPTVRPLVDPARDAIPEVPHAS